MLSFGTKNLNCINVGEGIVPFYLFIFVMDDAGVSTERLHCQHVTGTDWKKKTGPALLLTAVPVKLWY